MNDAGQNSRKDSHRQAMLGYLARDVADAKAGSVVIGFKISARVNAMWEFEVCPRAVEVAGLYLVDELPDLYPEDCPAEDVCCCIDRESILSCDDTPDSRALRARIAERGLPEPPPPWEPIEPLTDERRVETLAMIEEELKVSPAKHLTMWAYLRDMFAKKTD